MNQTTHKTTTVKFNIMIETADDATHADVVETNQQVVDELEHMIALVFSEYNERHAFRKVYPQSFPSTH